METTSVQVAGRWCALGAAIAVAGATITYFVPSAVPEDQVSSPYTPLAFQLTEGLWAITHLLLLFGAVGLVRAGVLGRSRAGVVIAQAGLVLMALCEAGYALYPTAKHTDPGPAFLDTAIGVAAMATGLGYILMGVAVLRTGRWQGAARFLPLACGVFVFVALMPSIMLLPALFPLPIALWSVLYVLLGLALSSTLHEWRGTSSSDAEASWRGSQA
ncbi:hypothetical protein ACIBH1_32920 [Nonomuraea sp. NPDC050663]|uniref:hypothetical protein n=1 Tax=Nonomuraea sp. NPDC050663 TaxID=3364370 RepID=UPI00379D6B8D